MGIEARPQLSINQEQSSLDPMPIVLSGKERSARMSGHLNPRKVIKGLSLIQNWQNEIYFFHRETALESQEWRTSYSAYQRMLRLARRQERDGVRIKIEGEGDLGGGFSGILGTETTTPYIDYAKVFEKGVDVVFIKEQQKPGLTQEWVNDLLDNAEAKGEDPHEVYEREAIPRIPRSKEEIAGNMRAKYFYGHLWERNKKIQAEAQRLVAERKEIKEQGRRKAGIVFDKTKR